MNTIRENWRQLAILFVLCAVLFGFKLGAAGLLDPDEPFYALTAKEMLATGHLATPIMFGQPQFEKPVFFYWVLCGCFKLFGITEFAARLGPCLAGTALVLLTYLWGLVLFKRKGPAFFSAVILATAAEFVTLSHIVLTDMFLGLFVAAALYAFSVGYEIPRLRKIAWNLLFFFSALGFLTKGPLGLLLPFFGIVAFLLWTRQGRLLAQFPWVTGTVIFLVVGVAWYVQMTVEHGAGFLRHFFIHENVRRFFVAEHKNSDKIFFYPLVLLGGFFPWTVFVPAGLWHGFKKGFRPKTQSDRTSLFLSLSILLPFIFFTCAHSKLMSYIFPVFPMTALLTGAWVWRFARAVGRGGKIKLPLVLSTLLVWGFFPFVLVGGALFYDMKNHVGILAQVLWLGVAVIPLSWLGLFFFLRKKITWTIASLVLMVTCFSCIAFGFLMPVADIAFASKKEAGIYAHLIQDRRPGFLLASKLFVRGVVYYTGNANVAVFADDPRNLFYTKHPIPIYSTREDLEKISPSDFPVYCFLRQKEYKHLKTLLSPRYGVTVLDTNAQRVFLRLDRNAT